MLKKKVLVAYDGSAGADAALRDLEFAGLPSDAQCLVLTVADVWLPREDDAEDQRVISSMDSALQARGLAMRNSAREKVAEAAAIAKRGADMVESILPKW